MAIIFPSGNTCEIYEYGWKSGCTDDNGVTRGITQGWYFDEVLQAWVSVSNELKNGTTGPTGSIAFDEVVTSGYSFVSHTAPTIEGTETGSLRKFLLLQEDGSVTAAYIKLPDLVDPVEESLNISSFTWNSLANLDYSATGIYKSVGHSTTGVTLCGPSSHVYDFGFANNDGNANDDAVATVVIDNGVLNLAPITKGLTLDITAAAGVYTPAYVGLNGDNTLPWSPVNPVKGTNQFIEGNGGPILGISAGNGGPAYQLAVLTIEATAGGEYQSIGRNSLNSSYLHTENLVYFFAATADYYKNESTNAGVTGTNFLSYAKGPSGGAFILPAKSGGLNHAIGNSSTGQRLTSDDFGNAAAGAYLYVCAPSRVNIKNNLHLFYDYNDPTPYGFERGITSPHQNKYAYEEPYLIYRTGERVGVLTQGMLLKGPGNS